MVEVEVEVEVVDRVGLETMVEKRKWSFFSAWGQGQRPKSKNEKAELYYSSNSYGDMS